MKNPNALIAMAQVAQNASNPYATFCEYIKYCVFANVSDVMTLTEIREAVGREFGLFIPHNVLLECVSHIQNAGVISCDNHQIKRIGSFDTDSFDKERDAYRATEFAIIQALVQYGSKYNREWTTGNARELLIKVLDRSGLAYDIFLHEKSTETGVIRPAIVEDEVAEMLPDDEDVVAECDDGQPLFADEYFVGKFIEEILAGTSLQKDYLKKICEGLMLCVGTYQLPTADVDVTLPQIAGTSFFFDTKLLLRFVGCAGEAAVAAVTELVSLIQGAGGNIYYYPQTLQEMECAFDSAIKSLTHGFTPRDEEMRLYVASVKNSTVVVAAKKASFRDELKSANIHLMPHGAFTETERIHFGFDRGDLEQYMRANLPWDPQAIDNDAFAIWETHMRRHGDYSEYCGTGAQLPVFVTTNSRLISIALRFRENRPGTKAINLWRPNRLPVITDIRLTCRLWSPGTQGERMSLLYLAANIVAAKRPTKRYLDSIRSLAIQLGEQAPEYSGICLPAYFDDNVTEVILEHTLGVEENLNIASFASSIAELSEWKAKEQEELTRQAITEKDEIADQFKTQREEIIEGAVETSKKLFGWRKVALWLILNWPVASTIVLTSITAVAAHIVGNSHILWAILVPTLFKIIEICTSSCFVTKLIVKRLFPPIEDGIERRIKKNLRKAERPYTENILDRVKEQTDLWIKCKKMMDKNN